MWQPPVMSQRAQAPPRLVGTELTAALFSSCLHRPYTWKPKQIIMIIFLRDAVNMGLSMLFSDGIGSSGAAADYHT